VFGSTVTIRIVKAIAQHKDRHSGIAMDWTVHVSVVFQSFAKPVDAGSVWNGGVHSMIRFLNGVHVKYSKQEKTHQLESLEWSHLASFTLDLQPSGQCPLGNGEYQFASSSFNTSSRWHWANGTITMKIVVPCLLPAQSRQLD
jgi:hypothetical protein